MFCPKCATQNLEGASFCRSCGANISLIPQALSGQPVQPVQYDPIDNSRAARRARRREKEPSLDHAFRNGFMGIAFLIVAIAVARTPGGAFWWYWMLIPAFSMMATGISQYLRIKERDKKAELEGPHQPMLDRGGWVQPQSVNAPRGGELRAPVPSVTEGTTRHLGAEAPTRHIDAEHE